MDLVTLGEAMVRLTPPGFQRLEQARALDVCVGGAELNVAVAAARLGLASSWISRLPDNALGRMIASRGREAGVDVSRVAWSDAAESRAGLYFVEHGAAPRGGSVLYDRAGSAASHLAPHTIDWNAIFAGARWFHTSGITPALSDSAAAAAAEALAAAKGAGLTVSYDLNFRGKLWSAAKARAVQEPLMRDVDVLITSSETAQLVFGVGDAEQLRRRFGLAAVATPARESSRAWQTSFSAMVAADGATHRAPTYEVEVVDEIGSGDAFVAGLIFGRLRLDSWDAAIRYGAALAALKCTVPGDMSQATLSEVEALLGRQGTNATMRVSR
jgi:2-dehydro-3-deoxygluconokinase